MQPTRGNNMRSTHPIAAACAAAAICITAGCEGGARAPVAPASVQSDAAVVTGQPASRCVNVSADGTAPLGFAVLPDGTAGFGADWSAVTLGGIEGEMASAVISQEASGSRGQGAVHLILKHAFRTSLGDYFITEDKAVCAPAGPNPATCRVNDVLTLVSGTGIFSNASGSLRNHGTLDFFAGTLDFSLRGRICGDGL